MIPKGCPVLALNHRDRDNPEGDGDRVIGVEEAVEILSWVALWLVKKLLYTVWVQTQPLKIIVYTSRIVGYF